MGAGARRSVSRRWRSVPARRIALVGETLADVRRVMIEGVSGLLAVHARRRAAACSRPRRGSSSGRTGRSRRCSRPRSRTACAGRSSMRPGATSSPSGASRRRAWDMLQFALAAGRSAAQVCVTTTPRPMPLLKKLIEDAATVVTRARDGRQRGQPGAGLRRRDDAALCRHGARAAGARRARSSTSARARCGGATGSRRIASPQAPRAAAHRRRGRSAGDGDGDLGRLRHRRRGAGRGRARLCARRPHAAGPRAAGLGAGGGRGVSRVSWPTASSPRPTRAATWSWRS